MTHSKYIGRPNSCVKSYIIKQRVCTDDQNFAAVKLSRSSIIFYCTNKNWLTRKSVYIENTSTRPLRYSIDCEPIHEDSGSIFPVLLGDCIGNVPSASRLLLLFGFYPAAECCYSKKIDIFVEDQLPLSLTLIGICCSDELRGSIRSNSLIAAAKWQGNLTKWIFSTMKLKSSDINQIEMDSNEIDFTETRKKSIISHEWARRISTGTLSINDVEAIPTCFTIRVTIRNQHKSSSCQLLWAPRRRLPDWKSQQKFSPLFKLDGETAAEGAFSIEPNQLRIPARSKTEFVVYFRPKFVNQCFEQLFEAHCSWESNVNESSSLCKVLSCLQLRCRGNTLGIQDIKGEKALSYKVNSTKIKFAPLAWDSNQFNHQVTLRNIILSNEAESTLIYETVKQRMQISNMELLKDSSERKSQLSCLSKRGYIAPGSHAILTYMCHLPAKKTSTSDIQSGFDQLGASDMSHLILFPMFPDAVVALHGMVETGVCDLVFVDGLTFSPTVLGNFSRQKISFFNPSLLPIQFSIQVLDSFKDVLMACPDNGLIEANSTQLIEWIFAPNSVGIHQTDVNVFFSYANIPDKHSLAEILPKFSGNNNETRHCKQLSACITANLAQLSVDNGLIDLGPVTIATSTIKSISIYNSTPCPIEICVHLESMSAECAITNDDSECCQLQNSGEVLVVPTNGYVVIGFIATPFTHKPYEFSLSYSLPHGNGIDVQKNLLAKITFRGVYPCVRFTDVDVCGTHPCIGRYAAWKELRMDEINEFLQSHPTKTEINPPIALMPSNTRQSSIATFDLPFAVVPLCKDAKPTTVHLREIIRNKSGPILRDLAVLPSIADKFLHRPGESVLHLLIENCGHVFLSIDFFLPSDKPLLKEIWAENRSQSQEEVDQLATERAGIFELKPRNVCLQVGETVSIRIVCKHYIVGKHILPVRMCLKNGNEVILNLMTETIPPEYTYLQIPREPITFEPLPLTAIDAYHRGVEQSLMLRNPSPIPLRYILGKMQVSSSASTSALLESNFVLKDKMGIIEPGCWGHVTWKFKPIEALAVEVRLPVYYADGSITSFSDMEAGLERLTPTTVFFQSSTFDPLLIVQDLVCSSPRNRQFKSKRVPPLENRHRLNLPAQCFELSEDILDFGKIILHGTARRILFLNYHSPVKSKPDDQYMDASFTWTSAFDQFCQIEPREGVIKRNQSIMISFHIFAGICPKMFNMNLVCKIVPKPNTNSIGGIDTHFRCWPIEIETIGLTVTGRAVGQDEIECDSHEACGGQWINWVSVIDDHSKVKTTSFLNNSDETVKKSVQTICEAILSNVISTLLGDNTYRRSILLATSFSGKKTMEWGNRQKGMLADPVPLWRQITQGAQSSKEIENDQKEKQSIINDLTKTNEVLRNLCEETLAGILSKVLVDICCFSSDPIE